MSERLTEKQIAQTYYLDDIVIHEIILDALQQLIRQVSKNPVAWSKTDLIYKLVNLALDNHLVDIFNLESNEIIKTVHEEYSKELDEICLLCQR